MLKNGKAAGERQCNWEHRYVWFMAWLCNFLVLLYSKGSITRIKSGNVLKIILIENIQKENLISAVWLYC